MLISIIVFLLVLGVLVFVHELGHFAVAKWVGMRVDEFAIGFPPRLFGKKKGETLYAINAIPLGGYVKIHGESAHGEDPDPRAFPNRPLLSRIAVILAGVTMNLLFAFLILCVAFSFGFPSGGLNAESVPGAVVTRSDVLASQILAGSPAEKAGVEPGEFVKSFTNKATGEKTEIVSVQKMLEYTAGLQQAGQLAVAVELSSEGKTRMVDATINASGPALGVAVEDINYVKVPFYRSPEVAVKGIAYIGDATWQALKGFGVKLFTKAELDETVSGPVGIYRATASAADQGWASIVFLTAALSVNLALLNIMPIPALDGGKLVFLVIEGVFRKRVVSEQIENAVTGLSFFALIALIAVISLRDLGLF
jgi:regulator of sigma E protease